MRIVIYEVDTEEKLIFPMNHQEIQVKVETAFRRGAHRLIVILKLLEKMRRNDPFEVSGTDLELYRTLKYQGNVSHTARKRYPINYDVY